MSVAEQLKALKKKVEDGLDKNPDLDFILEEVPRIIRVRTRLGKGVDKGNISKLNPLSEKYIEKRKKGKLSAETKPKKSNLTFTGQMLDAIVGVRKGTHFIFSFKGSRGDSDKTNDDLAKYAREKGRPFFELSESERKGLSRKITTIIKESIKKLVDK